MTRGRGVEISGAVQDQDRAGNLAYAAAKMGQGGIGGAGT